MWNQTLVYFIKNQPENMNPFVPYVYCVVHSVRLHNFLNRSKIIICFWWPSDTICHMSKRQPTAVLSQTPTGQAAIFHKCTTTSPDLAQSFQNQRNVTINQALYESRKSVFTEMNSEKTFLYVPIRWKELQLLRVAIITMLHTSKTNKMFRLVTWWVYSWLKKE